MRDVLAAAAAAGPASADSWEITWDWTDDAQLTLIELSDTITCRPSTAAQ